VTTTRTAPTGRLLQAVGDTPLACLAGSRLGRLAVLNDLERRGLLSEAQYFAARAQLRRRS
jgi:hypothetical protein